MYDYDDYDDDDNDDDIWWWWWRHDLHMMMIWWRWICHVYCLDHAESCRIMENHQLESLWSMRNSWTYRKLTRMGRKLHMISVFKDISNSFWHLDEYKWTWKPTDTFLTCWPNKWLHEVQSPKSAFIYDVSKFANDSQWIWSIKIAISPQDGAPQWCERWFINHYI